jgi:pyridoxine 5-phosphate synthase
MKTSKEIGVNIIEIHTGKYCDLAHKFGIDSEITKEEFQKIAKIAKESKKLDLECHAGHGINYQTISQIKKIPEIEILHIGHFAISQAVFDGLENVTKKLIFGN